MIPNEDVAKSIAETFKQKPVRSVSRFTTGLHHYVYQITFDNDEPIVVRLTTENERKAMEGAVRWNQFFFGKGVLLPKLLGFNLEGPFPYMLIQRLPGEDLEFIFDTLSTGSLRTIASKIGEFQRIARKSLASNKFGYAFEPESAPYDSWLEVVKYSLARSRMRIQAAGVIDPIYCNRVEEFVYSNQGLAQIESIPFFHDLTSKNVIVTGDGKLTGVVDIDDLCFGDPTYHLALTKVALAGRKNCEKYIEYLMATYDGYNRMNLNTYLGVFYLDLLSEIGQTFNGNFVRASPDRIAFLLKELADILK